MARYYAISKYTLWEIGNALRSYGAGRGQNRIAVDDLHTELYNLSHGIGVPKCVRNVTCTPSSVRVRDVSYDPEALTVTVALTLLTTGETATIQYKLKSFVGNPAPLSGQALVEKETLAELADVVRDITGGTEDILVSALASRINALGLRAKPAAFESGWFVSSDISGNLAIGSATYYPASMRLQVSPVLGTVYPNLNIYLDE